MEEAERQAVLNALRRARARFEETRGHRDTGTRGNGDGKVQLGNCELQIGPMSPKEAVGNLFRAYDRMLDSIPGHDGELAEATELERIALVNRIRRRFAINAKMPPG